MARTTGLIRIGRHGPDECGGMGTREDREGQQALGMSRGDEPRELSAPVVSHEVEAVRAEGVGDRQGIADEALRSVGIHTGRSGSRGIAALIGGDGQEARVGERGELVPPRMTRLREAVQEQHQGIGHVTGRVSDEAKAPRFDLSEFRDHDPIVVPFFGSGPCRVSSARVQFFVRPNGGLASGGDSVTRSIAKGVAGVIAAGALLGGAATAQADNDIGCGVGTMVMEGKEGLVFKLIGSCVNGITFQSISITFGLTNCNGRDTVTAQLNHFTGSNFDRLAADMAAGEGETLAALGTLLGVAPEDRDAFNAFTQAHFAELYAEDTTRAGEMLETLSRLMREEARLKAYARS